MPRAEFDLWLDRRTKANAADANGHRGTMRNHKERQGVPGRSPWSSAYHVGGSRTLRTLVPRGAEAGRRAIRRPRDRPSYPRLDWGSPRAAWKRNPTPACSDKKFKPMAGSMWRCDRLP